MRKTTKKLPLRRQTIRSLDRATAAHVAGARMASVGACPSENLPCGSNDCWSHFDPTCFTCPTTSI